MEISGSVTDTVRLLPAFSLLSSSLTEACVVWDSPLHFSETDLTPLAPGVQCDQSKPIRPQHLLATLTGPD